MFSYTLIYSFF